MVHVGGLKVEEVEEGRVVDGERGPRRGDARGRGGMAGSGRMPRRRWGGGVGRMPAGSVAGRSLGLHDVPGEAARGGPAYSVGMRDVEASFWAPLRI